MRTKLPFALLALLLLLALPVLAQKVAPALPLNGDTPLIDNERVTVSERTIPKGKQTVMIQNHPWDVVIIELANATVKATARNNTSQSESFKIGQVTFKKRRVDVNDEGTYLMESTSETPRRTVFINLKDVAIAPLKNTTKFPDAFPRDGAKKLLENDRVIVWDYTWQLGKPTPMHFHTLDTVTVALENGEVKSTPLDGQVTVNTNSFGLARFNPKGRTHTEELVKGAARSIIVELK
jgi:hypothetical protein